MAIDARKYTGLAEFLDAEHDNIWISYDQEADVVYISFEKPAQADDSEMIEDNIVVRTRDGEVVGITLLNGSNWMEIT